jgi:hypothetical protein
MEREETAAVGLATVAGHPASSVRTRDKAKHLLDDLALQLSPETIATARERHEGKTLDDVIAEMLEEI